VPICALQMRCTYPVTLGVRLGVRRAGLPRQSAALTPTLSRSAFRLSMSVRPMYPFGAGRRRWPRPSQVSVSSEPPTETRSDTSEKR
jgi:hypothetical protein